MVETGLRWLRQKTDTLSADRQGISPGQTAPRASKRHELALKKQILTLPGLESAEDERGQERTQRKTVVKDKEKDEERGERQKTDTNFPN